MSDFNIVSTEEYAIIEKLRKEKQHEEYKYLHLLQKILDEGSVKGDRTGTGTKSIYGTQLKFDLRNSLPVLTTKKVFFRGVVEELLWFIRGETDSKKLEAKGVNIWRDNTTREFLDKRGLNYPVGMTGPVYGWQWRSWGKYYNPNPDPNAFFSSRVQSSGIDQLANVVDTIKKNPNDRRMIVSAYNPDQLDMMSLPPCHVLHQYYVENGHLHLMWFQRSNDVFLGSTFNICSYAILTHLIAKITGLKPGSITCAMGDTHIYLNHIDQCKEQISRIPYPFPKLNIKKDIKTLEDIEKLQFEDFELIDYKCHPAIKAPMAI